MNILLLGQENSITQTIQDMLQSVDGWIIDSISSWQKQALRQAREDKQSDSFDLIVGNLSGYPDSPKTIITAIIAEFSDTPLLVLYSYSRSFLIKPLLAAGATGYLEAGSSEEQLFKAIETVADGQQYIATENTYQT